MTKVHVVLRKEDVDEKKISGKIAVVFDVLLATSTITTALVDGAKAVIPVKNEREARQAAQNRHSSDHILVGEYEGKTIKGFYDPMPTRLKQNIEGKEMILSTTNGTVAIKKCMPAKKILISSLLNGKAVANLLLSKYRKNTIIIVCSGSSGHFCLEDFYGAGHLLHHLSLEAKLDLTDAAKAAKSFYESNYAEQTLFTSRVGEMLTDYGFEDEVRFVSQKDCFNIVPYFDGEKVVI